MLDDLSPSERLFFNKIKEFVSSHGNLSTEGFRDAYLERRFRVRMGALKINTMQEYYHYLTAHPSEEITPLWNTIAINVTRFFRNAEVFEKIRTIVFPELFKKRTIAIWSAGCSVGEEAYSIGMMLKDALGPKLSSYAIRIIGTDIDEDAMEKGRKAIYYNPDDFQEVPARYRQYIIQLPDKTFTIDPMVKALVRFERNDLLKDPPLQGIDLILCRNAIIYFEKTAQQNIFLKFYDALNPGGYLVLGGTESLSGDAEKKFDYIDIAARIYRKR